MVTIETVSFIVVGVWPCPRSYWENRSGKLTEPATDDDCEAVPRHLRGDTGAAVPFGQPSSPMG